MPGMAEIEMTLGWVIAGCEPLAAPADKPQGQRVGYVRDPFGMLVELATPL
jgi:lactoylglutathione lyase